MEKVTIKKTKILHYGLDMKKMKMEIIKQFSIQHKPKIHSEVVYLQVLIKSLKNRKLNIIQKLDIKVQLQKLG